MARAKGTGKVFKRGNSWVVAVEMSPDPVSGKRRQHSESLRGATRKQAEARLLELRSELAQGTFVKPAKSALKDFLAEWLQNSVRPNCAPKTAQNYEHIIQKNIAGSPIGAMAMSDITPRDVQGFITGRLDTGLASRTVRHHYEVLHRAFEVAVKWGVVARNPVDVIDPPQFVKPEMKTLCEEDVARLLKEVQGTIYAPIFSVALFTGMRRSEYLGLKQLDIDLKAGTISVNRSLHYLQNGTFVITETKTAKSRRLIAMTPSLIPILARRIAEQRAVFEERGQVFGPDTLLFCHEDGSPLLPDTVTRQWIRVTRKLGLNIRLHDARHTMATLMLRAGIHPKVVSERLGHASVVQTLDTYSHITPSMGKAAAFQLDQLLAEELAKAGLT